MTYINRTKQPNADELLNVIYLYRNGAFSTLDASESEDFRDGYLYSIKNTMEEFLNGFPDLHNLTDVEDVAEATELLSQTIENAITSFFDDVPDSETQAGYLAGLLDGYATMPTLFFSHCIHNFGMTILDSFRHKGTEREVVNLIMGDLLSILRKFEAGSLCCPVLVESEKFLLGFHKAFRETKREQLSKIEIHYIADDNNENHRPCKLFVVSNYGKYHFNLD